MSAKTQPTIKPNGGPIRTADLQPGLFATVLFCRFQQLQHDAASQALAAMRGCNTDVHDMRTTFCQGKDTET